MFNLKMIVTLTTLSFVLLGCGLGPERSLPKAEDPGSTTTFVGGQDTDRQGPGDVIVDEDPPPQVDPSPQVDPPPQVDPRLRVAVVVDISQSMNVTDPLHPMAETTARQRAALELVNHLNDGDAAFAFIPFNGRAPVVNAGMFDGFTDAGSIIEPALYTLSQGEGTSDYQGALTVVRDLIAEDMATSTAEELARSNYSVIFLADGLPSLICRPGCHGESICDEPREQWNPNAECDDGSCGPTELEWPMLEQCGAYNTPQSLQGLVEEITSLSATAEVRLNTVLLGSPYTPAWVFEQNGDFLKGMATAGGGIFLEVFDPAQLNFIGSFDLGL